MDERGFDAVTAMPSHLRHWVEGHGEGWTAPAGSTLIREGFANDRLWWLLEGSVTVTTTTGSGEVGTLATLGPGGLFGEMSLLDQRLPVASVVSRGPCRLLTVELEQLRAGLCGDPTLARELHRLLAHKLAAQLRLQNAFVTRWPGQGEEPLRKVLILFAVLDDADVQWMALQGRRRRLATGDRLIVEGEPVGELHVILDGVAMVSLRQTEGDRPVGSSHRGEILGEMSLLGGDGLASASVTARENLLVLSVPNRILSDRLDHDPGFATRFHRGMALLLSDRSRRQLLDRGLASRSLPSRVPVGAEEDEPLDPERMGAISRAGQRFDWLCRNSGSHRP